MGQVSVPVNGRSYAITCDDGQEIRIRRLAQYIDAKVAEFVGSVGQVGEARLLLLAALVIADELSDANDALERERNSAENASNGRDETAGRVAPIAAGQQTP
jgi:cell division protein ZapA